MMYSKQEQEPEQDQDIIEPMAFTPADGTQASKRLYIKPLTVLLSLLLLLGATLVWFLFTARSVVIQTYPATEHYRIEGGLKFEIEQHYVMRQGRYRLTASHPGYYPLDEIITVGEQQNQIKTFEFKKLPGILTVNTNVPAKVWIDNQPIGDSGNALQSISAGAHQIKVAAPRHFSYTDTIEISGMNKHQQLNVALNPAWADVSIRSEPQGAELFSDLDGNDQSLGVTPLTKDLIQGKHLLRLNLPGYKSWQQSIDVTAGKAIELPMIYLQRLDGILQLSTSPNTVSVTIDDKYQGTTPITLYLTPDKPHRLSLFKDGYQQHQQQLTLPSGKAQNLDIKLKPQLGQVTVNASEEDALLYVDGRLMGRANQTLTLIAKQHRLEIKKTGFADHQTTILPRDDLEQIVNVNLRTIEQARWDNIDTEIETVVGAKLKLFKPEGEFSMGASRREQGRRANEVKRRIVLKRPFYLGIHEISNGQFRRFSRHHSSGHVQGHSLNGNHQPVVNVSWKQAALYCNWLSEKEQLPVFYQVKNGQISAINQHSNGYRLPTEAEWAWISRYHNGKMRKYGWGNQLPPAPKSGNFADRSGAAILGFIQPRYDDSYPVTAPIASFAPNDKGIFDLSGNVAEWVNDFYEVKTGFSRKLERDPLGSHQGDYHVIRGSSWAHGNMTELRLSFRDYGNEPRNDVGFRIARFVDANNRNHSTQGVK